MRITGAVALVTGANRGLGRELTAQLAERGARTVYGAARDPATLTQRGVVPVELDITDPAQVARAAEQCRDVSILINNAGVMTSRPLLGAPDTEGARQEMATNYFGTLDMCRAFAPVLAANGGGALVNVLSVVSFFINPGNGSYGASKAAEWALTNGARVELARQGTLVMAVHSGYIDTDMAAGLDVTKNSAADVARQVLDGLEGGQVEVLTDERTRKTKAALSRDHELIYPDVQAAWDARPAPG